MKVLNTLFAILFFIILFNTGTQIFAQTEPVLYFCQEYDGYDGEVGVADRFTTGYLTVMVKCDTELDLKKVHIQFDKLNFITKEFDYYKKFDFTVQRDMKYIYFSKNENADMKFEDPGIYRVFLLDSRDETVASALIEII